MEYNPNNVFYKIIHKQISCNIVYEDEGLIAINDINPSAPVHLLIIPKSCYVSFDDFMIKNSAQGIVKLFQTVHKIAQIKNLTKKGYRIVMNHGKNASQTIMHFHIHLIGGKKISGLSSDDEYNR